MFDNQYYNRDRQMKTGGNGRQAQEEASFRKATADTQFFWNQVTRNNGAARKLQRVPNPQLRAREESQLFGNHTDVLQGVIQDSTPVERSGPGADSFPVLEKFSDLSNLPSFIARNIRLMRYESPSPIQKHSVPLGLAGLDLMCCAQTGSGKTFAFLLPVITSIFTSEEAAGQERCPSPTLGQDAESGGGIRSPSQLQGQIDERGCMPKAIILAPTRELACQIHTESKKLCHNSDMKTVVVYGGSDIRAQLSELSTGCDMIVATPGRLNDLVDRGVVSFCKVIFLVLDEADRMLDMGFEVLHQHMLSQLLFSFFGFLNAFIAFDNINLIMFTFTIMTSQPQIRRIVQENDMPSKDTRQTFLFSATFPDEIQSLAREFLRDYVWIGVGRVGSTVENIEQRLLEASSDPNVKLNMLLAAINEIDGRTLVFVQKKRTAAWVCQCLQQYGVPAEEIHGDRTQMQREHALRQFREGRTRVLVATDVAARGLDVPAVTHVIQFDMPISSEDFDTYVHRIGRTGRAGKSGVATSFYVSGRETGEGNGKIAQLLMRLLQENNQVVPDWFMSIDDHRYGGGGSVRRPPYNNGQQGRGPSYGGRDVRGNQVPTQQMNYGPGAGPGSFNNTNRMPRHQGLVRGPTQMQGQYKQYGDSYQQQGPGSGMQYQNQGGFQAHNADNQQQQQQPQQQQQQQQQPQQQQQQQPYLRSPQMQQQNSNGPGPRYAPQPQPQVGSNPQYGQQVASYGGMMPAQNYIPPPTPGAVPQSAFYDNNYGMVYVPPAGIVAGSVDGVASQMAQVQINQQRGNYSSNRSPDSAASYSPAPRVLNPQNIPYQQGYNAVPSMPGQGANHYDQQGSYPSPQAQGHSNPYMQGQQPQRNGYPGNFSPTGRMGRGMGGRALNVDARPFKASGIAMGQTGREYQNQGPDQGQGQGHPSEQSGHHTAGMSNISYSPGTSTGAYASQPMTAYSASTGNGNPAGNTVHNLQSPHSDAHSPSSGDGSSGGRGAVEGGQPPSAEPSSSA